MNQPGVKIAIGMIVLLSLGTLVVASVSPGGNAVPEKLAAATATPTDPVLASLNDKIDRYQKYLQNDKFDLDTAKGLRAQLKYMERQATERVNYLAHAEDMLQVKFTTIANLTLTPYQTEPPEKTPTAYDGLFPEFYAPKYREGDFSTAWLSRTEKRHLFIISGSYVEDPDQGIVYVENRTAGIVQKYKSPYKDGSLRIIKLEKNLLYLNSRLGRQYILDVEKKVFVDELGNPIPGPTPTPIPANTLLP